MKPSKTPPILIPPTLEYYEAETKAFFLVTKRKRKHPNFTGIIYFG